jgi:hypothetical protein
MMPGVDEIDADAEFSAEEIGAEVFEQVWRRAVRGG